MTATVISFSLWCPSCRTSPAATCSDSGSQSLAAELMTLPKDLFPSLCSFASLEPLQFITAPAGRSGRMKRSAPEGSEWKCQAKKRRTLIVSHSDYPGSLALAPSNDSQALRAETLLTFLRVAMRVSHLAADLVPGTVSCCP